MLNDQLKITDPAQLAAQARAAYEQRRTRDCIALTKALVQVDPDNAEAQELQSAIQTELQQDLHDARSLIEQSGTKEERKKYHKAAELILIKTLYLDPENEEAKILLQSARAFAGTPPMRDPHHRPQPQGDQDLPFIAAPPLSVKQEGKKKRRLKLPFALIATVFFGGSLVVILQSRPRHPASAPVARTEPRNSDVQQRAAAANAPSPPEAVLPAPPGAPAPAAPTQTPVASAPTQQPSTPLPAPTPAPNASAPPETGKLAVSSTVPAEIYMAGKYLGSTPMTLQLPAGRTTLEYRHGDLRTVVSHNLRPNEMTTAAITFQMTVQINAKPWAHVSLDGSPRRPLGQTPLSGIMVPIGSVLVFENPDFTPKSYRITEKDTSIQVDFP